MLIIAPRQAQQDALLAANSVNATGGMMIVSPVCPASLDVSYQAAISQVDILALPPEPWPQPFLNDFVDG